MREGRLKGKVAVITGAASGMGCGVAELFSREGAKVIIADLNDEIGQATDDRLGGVYKQVDVTSDEQMKELVDFTARTYGQLDVFHNNAGALGVRGSLLDHP